MADIHHQLPIKATADEVFGAVATPKGLDQWWTQSSEGSPEKGAEYTLFFGKGYDWRAVVTRCIPGKEFELELTRSMDDWMGTRVGFLLEEKGGATQLRFHHKGWPEADDHFCTSSTCWAMYLRILRRHLEFGETVPYEMRLDV
jgi:uncharacterized protein YndB with AHSA1/START domain